MSYNQCSYYIMNLIRCIDTNSSDIINLTNRDFEPTKCNDYINLVNKLGKLGIQINSKNKFTNDEITIHFDKYTKSLNIYPTNEFRLSLK